MIHVHLLQKILLMNLLVLSYHKMFWANAPSLDMLAQKIDGMLALEKIDDMFDAKHMLLA